MKRTRKHVVRVKLTVDVPFDPNTDGSYETAAERAKDLVETAQAYGTTKSDRSIKVIGGTVSGEDAEVANEDDSQEAA